ncbi:MAG TPA: mechanosensitive ion channel [Gemmatimonadales bacterium]|nr:mechanosensitive ion channel [Gemmatimonadales bacterium]
MRHSTLPVTLLLLSLASPLLAQTAPVVTTAADTLAPAAVPLPEIPTRAAATEGRLDEIGQILAPDRTIARVASAYEAAHDTITQVMALQKRPGQEQPTKRSLTDLHNEWVRRIDQMRAWQQAVGNRTDAMAAIQTELIRRDSTWQLTMTDARKANAQTPVLQLVDNILQRNEALLDTVETRIVTVVRLQSQIARTVAVLQQADDQTTEQLASLRRDLLHIDAPPIWKSASGADSLGAVRATFRADVVRTGQELAYFHEAYRLPFYLHLASTLGILLAVFWFRAKLDRHTSEQPAASARRILDHPFAGAWLIVTIAALFLYPRAPLAVYDIALLAGVPALLFLMPSFLPPNLVPAARLWACLFTIQRLGGLFLAGSTAQRPGGLVIALVGAAVFLRLLRKGGEFAALGPNPYAVALRVAARLSAAMLLFAAGSNVVGNVSLGQLIASGTITSTYLLLVLLAAVRIFDGILIVATRSEIADVSRYVAQRRDRLLQDGLKLVQFVSALLWVLITLTVFDVTGPLFAFVQDGLRASLAIGKVHLSLGSVLLFITTVWISVLLSRGLSSILEMDVLSRLDMPRGLPSVIGRLTRYTLIGLGVIFALAATGLELTQLTILGGALGVGVGFGLQTIVSNFVAGLILAFERPIREGDLIQVQDLTGTVLRIGFRATVVRTFEGAEVIVPNASLISTDVVNWTLSDQQRRLTVAVGVAYGIDPARVMGVLLAVPHQFPTILKTPEPIALFTGFGDSALNFELRFWTVDSDRFAVLRSEVTTAVNNALVAAGIEIPFPQRDLHLRSVDGPAAAQLRGAPVSDGEST